MIAHIPQKRVFRLITALLIILVFLPLVSSDAGTRRFYLCIGSFRNIETLKKYYNPLLKTDIGVFVSRNFERGRPFYHILLSKYYASDSKARSAVPSMELLLKNKSLLRMDDVWVFDKPVYLFDPNATAKDDSQEIDDDEFTYYYGTASYPLTIICCKGSAKKKITDDPDEKKEFFANQIIPEKGKLSGSVPLLVLFNKKVLLPSIIGHFKVLSGNKLVEGILRVFPYSENHAAFCFTPKSGYWPDGTVTLLIDQEMQSASGVPLRETVSGIYEFGQTPAAGFDNFSFESATNQTNLLFDGDGSTYPVSRDIIPAHDGNRVCALTTGKALVSQGLAIAGKSSYTSFQIPYLNGFRFAYDFISSEFNEFASSENGDVAFIVVWGKDFQKADLITSVNSVGYDNIQLPYKRFANLPDMGDSYVGHTGWKLYERAKWISKQPVFATFVISDVRESGYVSAILIDSVAPNQAESK